MNGNNKTKFTYVDEEGSNHLDCALLRLLIPAYAVRGFLPIQSSKNLAKVPPTNPFWAIYVSLIYLMRFQPSFARLNAHGQSITLAKHSTPLMLTNAVSNLETYSVARSNLSLDLPMNLLKPFLRLLLKNVIYGCRLFSPPLQILLIVLYQ